MLNNLNELDKMIYWACYEHPLTTYQIMAQLTIKGRTISYPYLCQRLGVLEALGVLQKIKSSGGKILYQSRAVETKKKEEMQRS